MAVRPAHPCLLAYRMRDLDTEDRPLLLIASPAFELVQRFGGVLSSASFVVQRTKAAAAD